VEYGCAAVVLGVQVTSFLLSLRSSSSRSQVAPLVQQSQVTESAAASGSYWVTRDRCATGATCDCDNTRRRRGAERSDLSPLKHLVPPTPAPSPRYPNGSRPAGLVVPAFALLPALVLLSAGANASWRRCRCRQPGFRS
jgi:hypothetical protein